jgi:hypothetical protein
MQMGHSVASFDSASTGVLVASDRHLHEPTISCPHCHEDIRLTESLAAPLLKSKELEFSRKEAALRDRESNVDRAVSERLVSERKKLAEEEQKRARLALGAELEGKQRALDELNQLLRTRDAKLAEAQAAQAELVRKQRELDDKSRELELTIEKRVTASVGEIQSRAKQEAVDEVKLKVLEKDQLIHSMQRQIEELRRKSEQGSQQLQGDVQELELASILSTRFATDTITRVARGEFGGDVMQQVLGTTGSVCGSILWESKRTKNWDHKWLAKLRQDQRAARADFAVIVSQVLPKEIAHFDQIDGVYVVSPQCVVPVAALLRKALLELAIARQSSEASETKAALVYQYLTGPRFRQRMQAMVEAFTAMQEDLTAERKAIQKQWAKRETQLDRMMCSTVGMYGDLQGIAGRSIQEIEGMDLHALPSSA